MEREYDFKCCAPSLCTSVFQGIPGKDEDMAGEGRTAWTGHRRATPGPEIRGALPHGLWGRFGDGRGR